MEAIRKIGAWVPPIFVALTVSSAASPLAASYSLTPIDVPGSSYTYALGINDRGQIVGFYDTPTAAPGSQYGFVYSGGTYTTLNNSQSETDIYGINNAGRMVGMYSGPNSNLDPNVLVYSNGTYSNFLVPSSSESWGFGINNAGVIVGAFDPAGDPSISYQGFIKDTNGYTFLDPYTEALGINDQGQVIGINIDEPADPGKITSFLYSNGAYTPINDPLATVMFGTTTWVYGINDRGQIVGYYGVTSGNTGDPVYDHGFLYTDGQFTTIDIPSAVDTVLTGINNEGDIVGHYDPGTPGALGTSFLLTPVSVPAPATLPLFATGLGALGLLGWYGKRKAQAVA